jgi:Complex I intermediate-associated protein 30 (CIA30)
MPNVIPFLLTCFIVTTAHAFIFHPLQRQASTITALCAAEPIKPKNDNKAMGFLRKIGKVGTITDFKHIMGVDEGPAGKSGGAKPLVKSRASYKSCVESSVIDDMTEIFPLTSAGTTWAGFTDRVMGGASSGSITREQNVEGRVANVLRGTVSLANNGGFIQMATDLTNDPSISRTVDASEYDGIEMDVKFEGISERDSFNVQ